MYETKLCGFLLPVNWRGTLEPNQLSLPVLTEECQGAPQGKYHCHHLAAREHICFWSENLSCCSLCLVGCRKHPREIQWQWFPHDWEDTDCILLPLETHQREWIGAIFSCDFTGWYLLRESRLYFRELKATRNKLKKPGNASACCQVSS